MKMTEVERSVQYKKLVTKTARVRFVSIGSISSQCKNGY